MPEQQTTPIPDLYLEQYKLGELPSALAGRVSAYAQTPEGQARLEALEVNNQAILSAHPARPMAALIAQRRAQQQALLQKPLLWSATAAAAVLCCCWAAWMFWSATQQPSPAENPTAQARVELPTHDGEEVLRAKGKAHLLIHRKRDAQPEPLSEGAHIQTGDLLQVSYLSAGAGFGVIISIDGRGSVTLHYPEQTQSSTALSPAGKAVGLPHAYLLDDAPSFERFILVTSSAPVDVNQVLEAAAALAQNPQNASNAALALPDNLQQSSVLLLKTNP